MKVHTKIVIDMSSGEVLEDECFDYEGPVDQCLGLGAIGGIIGGGLGLASSLLGPDQQTSTTQVQIPPWLLPLLQQQASVGQGALGQLESLLGGNTVAGFNPDQLAAIDLGRQRAMGSGGFFDAAQQQALQTARGDFMSGPGFQSAFEGALRQAQPRIGGAFSLGGRTGSGLAQTAQTQAAADAFAGLFNQERGRQLQAAQLLPGLATADVNFLSQIGGMQQAQQQKEILGPILAQQQLLQASGGPINLASLLGQQTSQPIHSNPFGAILGGGLIGSQLGGLFQSSPTPLQLSGPN